MKDLGGFGTLLNHPTHITLAKIERCLTEEGLKGLEDLKRLNPFSQKEPNVKLVRSLIVEGLEGLYTHPIKAEL